MILYCIDIILLCYSIIIVLLLFVCGIIYCIIVYCIWYVCIVLCGIDIDLIFVGQYCVLVMAYEA